jgi:hypothetical protein
VVLILVIFAFIYATVVFTVVRGYPARLPVLFAAAHLSLHFITGAMFSG